MSSRAPLLALAALLGCADLTESEGGVGTLVVAVPSPAQLEVSQTLQLQAVALSGSGDTLAIPIVWRGLDTTLTVDSATGWITGVSPGSGRVVARAADQYSSIITFAVLPRADTVILAGPDTLTVAGSDSVSGPLEARVEGGDPPVPLAGRRFIYQIVSPVFADTAARTVEFETGGLLATPLSTADGAPVLPPRLRRIEGRPAPDSALVTVTVYRPAGGPPVPGSGQQYTVWFLTP